MIKTNYSGYGLDLSALEVGDQVAIRSRSNYDYADRDAKPCTVSRITKTRIVVTYTNFQGEADDTAFMISTGREVGSSDSWRSRTLISIERKNKAIEDNKAQSEFQNALTKVSDVVKQYTGYRCSSITAEDKQKLIDLVSALTVRDEIEV